MAPSIERVKTSLALVTYRRRITKESILPIMKRNIGFAGTKAEMQRRFPTGRLLMEVKEATSGRVVTGKRERM